MSNILTSVIFKKLYNEAITYLKKNTIPTLKIKLKSIDNIYLKASNVENIKTIWQVDKKINLNDFYYPSKILVEMREISIESLSDFPSNGKIVIQGTAGQGKSIFLRYLVGKELKEGGTIPLFIELRKISEKNSLEVLIKESIIELGIDISSSQVKFIFESRKFSLILDAFDEIQESEIKNTITYIESLCSKYHHQKMIISSRPHSDIQMVTYFEVYDLVELNPSDFQPIISKFFGNEKAVVDDIILSINKNSTNIKNLLTTPLLLTLLAITYKSYNRIPQQLHEFYENLFYLLINRHDSTKPGFRREYKSNLNEREIENVFCAFSFYCMKEGKDSLNKRDAIEMVSNAMKLLNIENPNESDFLSDCIKNTCLIVKEGFDYHFIHKSIREYHAASYIKYSSYELKEKFYSAAILNSSRYSNELLFLKVLDEHLYNKLFLLPLYFKIFSMFDFNNKTKKINKKIFDNIEIVADGYGNVTSVSFEGTYSIDTSYFGLNEKIFNIIISNFHNINFKKKSTSYKLKDVDISNFVRNEIEKSIVKWCNDNYINYSNLSTIVINQSEIIEKMDF